MDVASSYTKENPQIVFLIGGPGSGKGTQSAKLVRDLKFTHISVGDLMRAEVASKSKEGQEIQTIINKGDIVPSELTVKILTKAIKSKNAKKYLIDGFPRSLEQALAFEQTYGEINFILNYRCRDEVLIERLLKRALTEGRADDNMETITNRIKVYHEQTESVVNFYARYGKVVSIVADGDVDSVYHLTRTELLPNLLVFYGPPASGQEELAEKLANRTGYKLVKLNDFLKARGVLNSPDEVKMDQLVAYLRDNPLKNFILHGFPENIRQVKIFVEHFAVPRQFYYFDFTKDQVENHIKDRTRQQRQAVLQEYDNYVKNRKDILNYFSNRPYFIKIQEGETSEKTWSSLLSHIAPEVIVLPNLPEFSVSVEAIDRICQNRDYVYVNMVGLVEDEMKRGTGYGKKLSQSLQNGSGFDDAQIELAKRALFNDPNRNKFILGGFPNSVNSIELFTKDVVPVKNAIVFAATEAVIAATDIYAYFQAQGKLININDNALDQFDSYVDNRCRYGFLVGAESAGRVDVANYLDKRYARVINFPKLQEELIKLYSTEENPLEELPFDKLIEYFEGKIKRNNDRSENILFDGWVYDKDQLAKFIDKVGAPNYVFWLDATEEVLGERWKVANKAEQVDEGEVEKINEEVGKTKQQVQVFQEAIQRGNNIQLYDIKVEPSAESTLRNINSIVYRRVFIFRNHSKKLSDAQLKNTMVNACIINGVPFIDVADLIKEQASSNDDLAQKLRAQALMTETGLNNLSSSVIAPPIVTDLITKRLQSLPPSKHVVLFNYPAAEDRPDGFYPRAIDELHQIEVAIGPVREIISVTDEPENYNIEDPLEERPEPEEVKEEVKAPKGEGEEGEEEPPKEEEPEDEEGKKPKFNPLEYQWTVSDGNPKSLSKLFHRRFNCQHIEQQLDKNEIRELNSLLKSSIMNLDQSENKDVDFYLEVVLH